MGHSNKQLKRHSYAGSPSAGMQEFPMQHSRTHSDAPEALPPMEELPVKHWKRHSHTPGMPPPTSEEQDYAPGTLPPASEQFPENVSEELPRHSYVVGTRSPSEVQMLPMRHSDAPRMQIVPPAETEKDTTESVGGEIWSLRYWQFIL
jgi:hypothetical protein